MRATVVLLAAFAGSLGAQIRPEVQLGVVARNANYRAEAGLGLDGTVGPYLRSGLVATYEVPNDAFETARARVEVQVRFLLDPLAEHRWGMSFGGGLGVQERPYMLFVADLEGPRLGRVRPAIQFAMGGGTRLAIVARGTRPNRR